MHKKFLRTSTVLLMCVAGLGIYTSVQAMESDERPNLRSTRQGRLELELKAGGLQSWRHEITRGRGYRKTGRQVDVEVGTSTDHKGRTTTHYKKEDHVDSYETLECKNCKQVLGAASDFDGRGTYTKKTTDAPWVAITTDLDAKTTTVWWEYLRYVSPCPKSCSPSVTPVLWEVHPRPCPQDWYMFISGAFQAARKLDLAEKNTLDADWTYTFTNSKYDKPKPQEVPVSYHKLMANYKSMPSASPPARDTCCCTIF